MREDRTRKYARAVIIALAAIGAKHVAVCTVLVIVLQKVIKLPVVSSLPVGCARARNGIFSGLNFPHTQTVLLDSSLAWCCFRRSRLFNFHL